MPALVRLALVSASLLALAFVTAPTLIATAHAEAVGGFEQIAQRRHSVGRSWHTPGRSWGGQRGQQRNGPRHVRGRTWGSQPYRAPARRHFRGRSWHSPGRSWRVRNR